MTFLGAIVGVAAFTVLAGFGAVTRWWFSTHYNGTDPAHSVPWGTFGANISASFLLGAVHNFEGRWAWLIGAALCGALSTFSTLIMEVVRLSESDEGWRGGAYLAVSIGAGLVAVWLGLHLTN